MNEYFDVLDEKGNKTGIKKLRSEVHGDGDWHASVHVWIVNSKGELLLQRRSPNKDSYPNMWDISSAGHIQAGDDALATVHRELFEELGVQVEPIDAEFLFKSKRAVKLNGGRFINNSFDYVYLICKNFVVSEFKTQKEEITEVRWMDFKDYKKLLEDEDPNYVPIIEYQTKLFAILEERYGGNKKYDIHKAAGILIKDRKVLVVRGNGKDYFKSPGGKLEPGESSIAALVRELREELQIEVAQSDVEKFGVFSSTVPEDRTKSVLIDAYLIAKWSGQVQLNPEDKVAELRWVDFAEGSKMKLASIFQHEVLPKLQEMNLID